MPFADDSNGAKPLISDQAHNALPRLGEDRRKDLLSARRQRASELAAAARAAHRAVFEALAPPRQA